MFCKNCGCPMDNIQTVCIKCGAPKGAGNRFCPNCGAQTAPGAYVCVKCGAPLNMVHPKSRLAAGLFGILLPFGVHNFYLGNISRGVAQLLLTFICGVGCIWSFIEGILILCGNINTDADGAPLSD